MWAVRVRAGDMARHMTRAHFSMAGAGAGTNTTTEYKTGPMVTAATAVAVNTASPPLCTIIMRVTSNSTICSSSNTTVNNHRCLSSHNLSRKITRFLGIRENRNNRLPRSPRISHCKLTKDCRRRIML